MASAAEVPKGKGAAQPAQGAASGIPASYLGALIAGALGALGGFALLLALLNNTGNLPPPAFSNSLCVDEKLNFLRERPVYAPDLLVVGSSVAWRHVDSSVFKAQSLATQPLNAGFCGLHANQSAYVANWLLDREPTIRQVVMVVDPIDFAGCWRVPDAVFNRQDADAYVYGQVSPWAYYLRYFDPRSLLRNSLTVKDQRANLIEWDPLVFSRFGDGPLEPQGDRGLFYGKPEALDAGCFKALAGLAGRLESEGRKLLVVSTPLHPDWKSTYDPDGSFVRGFDRRLEQALAGTDGRYWNADREWSAPEDGFVDAIHLRWSAAQQFSLALASQLQVDDRNKVAGN
ncbi:hypothetical protein ACTCUN_13660 [Stutzerimonas balearica]|uniref:hypothetical protein n=1 Tax=Stutzerimonas balearica TaxID=74829 RepID=UPI003F767F27